MMVAVDECPALPRKALEETLRPYLDVVRGSFARRALLVFVRPRHFRMYVLNQGPPPVYVPDLHPETDRQKRQASRLRLFQDEEVRLVFERVYGPEFGVRLAPVSQRVYVRG